MENQTNSDSARTTLHILGKATVHCKPDTVGIRFTMSVLEADYGTAFDGLNTAVHEVRRRLAEIGVARKELKTSNFSMNPQWSRVKDESVFNGYLAKHDLQLDLPHGSGKNRERINEALGAIADSPGVSDLRLSFKVSDVEAQRDRALQAAVAMGRHRAGLLAAAAGVKLGAVLRMEYGRDEIEIRHSVHSIHDYTLKEGIEAPDIEPGDLPFEETVALLFQIRNETS